MTHLLIPNHSVYSNRAELLAGRSGPANRPLLAVHPTESTLLIWEEWPHGVNDLDLLLTIAIEMRVHEPSRLLVYLGERGPLLATLETTCADPYQILTASLPADLLPIDGPLVIRLQMETPECLWLFAPDSAAAGGLEYHLPRIRRRSAPAESFLDRLDSLASLQTFSWKEGCVLDGLFALGKIGQIRQHLNSFGFESGELIYEDPQNHRQTQVLGTIETTLAFAHVAELEPRHPWIQLALDFWQTQIERNGQIRDSEMISSEGAYTVAYPMTAIANRLELPQWSAAAESLLKETYARLVQPEGIYLRHYEGNGKRTHRNWVRGLAWLLLGYVQTIRQRPDRPASLIEQFQSLASAAARFQRTDGLWNCFMDESEVLPDTAGTAGVAAAFALGVRAGLLDSRFGERARLARSNLHSQLTGEGFLTGCSQSNKAGESLQRSPYRTITPYSLGLLGLLEAASDSI